MIRRTGYRQRRPRSNQGKGYSHETTTAATQPTQNHQEAGPYSGAVVSSPSTRSDSEMVKVNIPGLSVDHVQCPLSLIDGPAGYKNISDKIH